MGSDVGALDDNRQITADVVDDGQVGYNVVGSGVESDYVARVATLDAAKWTNLINIVRHL